MTIQGLGFDSNVWTASLLFLRSANHLEMYPGGENKNCSLFPDRNPRHQIFQMSELSCESKNLEQSTKFCSVNISRQTSSNCRWRKHANNSRKRNRRRLPFLLAQCEHRQRVQQPTFSKCPYLKNHVKTSGGFGIKQNFPFVLECTQFAEEPFSKYGF